MKGQPIVALDIGSTKVACAIGLPHEDSGGVDLLGTALVPYPCVPEAWLADPLMVGQTIEQALEATAVTGDLDRALVAVNPPSLESEQVRVTIPLGDEPIRIRTQDVDRLQTSALHQALGVDREPLLVERLRCAGNGFDGIRDPRGLPATRLLGTFHILTIPMAAHRALVQAVESAGLEVARLTSTLPAAFASLADDELSHQRVLLIDVGGHSTTLGVFVEGILHAAALVPWGGLTLVTTIAKDLGVTMDQALTWSLEGTGCRKPEVRSLIKHHWQLLEETIHTLLKGEPRPDAIGLSGRGVLMDGFAEWVERSVGMTAVICRSPRTNTLGDLSRQVGLSTAIGILEMGTRASPKGLLRSPHLFDRLIDRTKTVLAEYF